MLKKNKRGWIRIVEAFIAILLIAGILVVSLDSGRVIGEETRKIYAMEQSMLKEIQLDQSSREDIFTMEINSIAGGNLENKLNQRKLNYIECEGKVCTLDDDFCEVSEVHDNDVYVQEISIFTDLKNYEPRKLRLFCWEK